MEKYFKKIKIIIPILLLGILFLGNQLREVHYATVPHPGETADEYGFAWAGLSFIKTGVPESWTLIDNVYTQVKGAKINVDDIYASDENKKPFTLVKPRFDQPPLFNLIIGGYSYLKGARDYVQTGVGIIRRPVLKISIITTILIFILGMRLYSPVVGLMSALIYSIVPTFMISSRLALSENGYIPLFLGAVILMDLYLKKKRRKYLFYALTLSVLGFYFKTSAVAIILSLFIITLSWLKGKERIITIRWILFFGLMGVLLYALYGAIIDWQTFVKVIIAQSKYFYGAGSEVFYSVLTSSKVALKNLTDGWVLLSWIAFIYLTVTKIKKDRSFDMISIPLFSYFFVFLFLGGEPYGWYRYPFFPFLSLSLGIFLIEMYKKENIPAVVALALLPFGTAVHRMIGQVGFQDYVGLFKVFILISLATWLSGFILKEKQSFWVRRVFMLLVFAFLVFLSIKEIIFLDYGKWFFVT
jgi:4-amino-4-deoxy-L-arabinose transferase-like glycosyltransferase